MEQQEMFMVDFQNDNDADLELAHQSFICFSADLREISRIKLV